MTTLSLSDRLAQRRRRRMLRWGIGAAVVAALAALLSVAWFTPVLELRSVEVTGGELTDPEEVRESVLSAHAGTPLPRIRLGALEGQLLDDYPKAAEIRARWSGPNSLRISVTDRRPVLAVPDAGRWDRYDGEGNRIDSVTAEPELPVLELDGVVDIPAAITSAVQFMAAVPEAERANIVSMTAGSPEDLRIVYLHEEDEVTIVFGSPEDAARKFEVARALLGTGPKTIDVSVPEVPVTS
ncbi:hypothetical protein GCM10022261_28080 [Brevibacterium daeguense]|uniref:POTRA domain-containing protein n=1 Tax=Brevibacterium daeguense TaxID=909936 RepID=A0ABP8ENB3_9MICO|nr:FtsQ-type POTRA domain-containing protein [Brevibacterium daeguense]